MFCSKCGCKLADDSKFCSSCGDRIGKVAEMTSPQSSKPLQHVNEKRDFIINSMNDVEHFLENASAQYSESINNALKAQLQIIKFVHNPAMVSSIFDLILEKLSLAVKLAETDNIRNNIKKNGALMVQSFIFFTEAKLQYERNKNKKEGQKLLVTAAEIFGDSVIGVLALAQAETGNIAAAKIAGDSIKGALQKAFQKDEGESFFMKAVKWFMDDIGEKEAKFYEIVNEIILKIHRRRSLFGKSYLLSELVLRYRDELIYRQTLSIESEKAKLKSKLKTLFLGSAGAASLPYLVLFPLHFIVYVFVAMLNVVVARFSQPLTWNKNTWGWITSYSEFVLYVLGVVSVITLIGVVILIFKYWKKRMLSRKLEKMYEDVYATFALEET